METIAVVGANLAGGRAAEALRSQGFDGRVVLIGAEPDPPYERPPLSKGILLGDALPDSTYLRTLDGWEADGVELVLGTRVTGIEASSRSIELDDGRRITADRVLLCTGGRPRQLNVPGVELDGVTYLREMGQSVALGERLRAGARVVVVGAGFIGSEVAAAARTLGCQVTMLEVAEVPLLRVLGPDLGSHYADEHRKRGVDLRTGVGISRIDGDTRVRRVVLSDGSHVDADVVVVGVGLEPATELAQDLGLDVANGIVVDEHCRTSMDGVFAAGDVANHPNRLLNQQIRLESWQNAQDQGVAAAKSMLGDTSGYSCVPWFWSDQYDLNLQIAGRPDPDDTVIYRGKPDTMDFCAFHVRDGRLVGVIAVNRRKEVRAAMKLIENRAEVGLDQLADDTVDLRKVAAQRR
jgi:3-phenylpropionate/trans-cinnamate dioxygenase ferredoxin reductase subunit